MAKTSKSKTRKSKTPKAKVAAKKMVVAKRPKPKSRATKARPASAAPRPPQAAAPLVPGEYLLSTEPIVANADRTSVEINVANKGDRPIQVGSHFHFFEVNRALAFERARAYGMRLDIAAGTAVRFEPGQTKKVALIALAGKREVWGFNALVDGPLDEKK